MEAVGDRVPAAVCWGLLAAWAVHDAEELATMAAFTQRADVPLPPVDQTHVNTAIGLMGAVIATAAASGAHTGGRSAMFQTALVGFGLHTLTHVGSAIALRRYTPGVVTAVLIAAPFSYWATRRLRAAGIDIHPTPRSFAWFPVVTGAVQLTAALLTHATSRPRRH